MSDLWYFAYGSNMCEAIFVQRRAIAPAARTWGWIDGYRLCFDLPVGPGERGVANIATAAGARTCGVAYLITHEQAEHLDRTEGVPNGFYRRIAVVVENERGERVDAFTYQSQFSSAGRKPSARYMGLLLDGACANGLPAEYVAFLRSFELAVDERLASSSPPVADGRQQGGNLD